LGPTGAPGASGGGGPQGAQGSQGAQGPPSDRRLKDNIKKLENVVETAKKIEGVSFIWDDTHEKISKNKHINFMSAFSGESIGVIAQDIEKVIPEIVFTDKDGYKSVQYGQLVSIGIGAVQEQQRRIESIYMRINKLKQVIGA
jgi:hypothetical protein